MRWFVQGAGTLAEVVGLGWALGLALFTSIVFALYLGGVASRDAVAPALVLALAGVAVGARALRTARRGDPSVKDSGPRALVAVGLGMAAIQVALAALVAVRSPLASFDAWSVWAFKARMFALGGPRPGYFRDPITLHTHPDYPLNLPLAEAALFHVPGALGVTLAGLVGPACLAALLLLFYAGLARLHGRSVAALATGALSCVPALPLQASGGDADVPLALYAGASALYLLLWWRGRRPADAVLMGLLAGGAAWTKKEGLPVALLLVLAFAAGEILRRDTWLRARGRTMIWVILGAAALPLPWLLFTHIVHPLGRDFLPLTPAVFMTHAGRLPYIAMFVVLQMLAFQNWSLLWVALAGVLLLVARRLTPSGRGLLLLLLGQLGIYVVAFVFSDWQPYTAHVQTSMDRLLVQTVPLALLLLVEATSALMAERAMTTERVSTPARRMAAQ
jgi:hypothetical protein